MKRPVPGLTIAQQSSELLCRMCLFGEARGESALGKLAVLWVIKNRAEKSGKSLGFEILRPYQFSSFNSADPNAQKLLIADKIEPMAWAACDAVAELFESGATTDPTHGADHYYVFDMPDPPAWGRVSEKWDERAVIGRHVFGVCP